MFPCCHCHLHTLHSARKSPVDNFPVTTLEYEMKEYGEVQPLNMLSYNFGASRVGFRKQLLNSCKSKCLSLSTCPGLLSFRSQEGRWARTNIKRQRHPRETLVAWFSVTFLIFLDSCKIGPSTLIRLICSIQAYMVEFKFKAPAGNSGNFEMASWGCRTCSVNVAVSILRFQRHSTSKKSSTLTTMWSGNSERRKCCM